MKILFIAPLPPPVTGQSLATRVFFDELIKFHQVDVINLSKESFEQGVNSFERIIQVVMILKEVLRKKKGVDMIYFTISESFAGNIKDILIYLICFNKLSKMIIHLHGGAGMRHIMRDQSSFLRPINRFIISRLGGIIVLGQYHVDIYSNIVPSGEIHIVPNFAEDYLFLKEEEIKGKFDRIQPLRILFLSNLIHGKGHNELVDAYLALDDNLKKRVIIDFAGGFASEIQKSEFLEKIQGNRQLYYHGLVGGAEKKDLFTRAHIFCLPTYYPYEGQPISILEAYATGCVVITTDHSGIRDVFKDKINGYEVQKRSANSIRLVIEQIIEKKENLFSIASFNRKIAHDKYRTFNYNASLLRIIEGIGSSSNDRQ